MALDFDWLLSVFVYVVSALFVVRMTRSVVQMVRTVFVLDSKLPPGVRGTAAARFLCRCMCEGIHPVTAELMRRLRSDVISVDLFGWKTFVILADHEKMVEAFQKEGDMLLRRPTNPGKPESLGIVTSTGQGWRKQRQFALNTLHAHGMGSTNFELRIIDEVRLLLAKFNETNGQPFDPMLPVGTATLNVISSILFSKTFEYGNGKVTAMLENLTKLASGPFIRAMTILVMFEGLFKIPMVKKKIIEERLKADLSRKIMQERIDEAKIHGVVEKGDIAEVYIREWLDQQKTMKKDETNFTESQLLDVMEDLFTGATETSKNILLWALLCMARHPDIQEKVYQELKNEIGKTLAAYSDRERTPYTEAVLLEVMRFSSLTPASYRVNDQCLELFGYHLEPETNVVVDMLGINRDEKLWKRPYDFYPEHFIGGGGKVINRDKINAFGVGKRRCPGESLAKMELYLNFTACVLTFRFQEHKDHKLPELSKARAAILRTPLAYKICAMKRRWPAFGERK